MDGLKLIQHLTQMRDQEALLLGTSVTEKVDSQAMVVLILPTFVSSEILPSSVAKAGVSNILSLSTLEHFGELYRVEMYSSPNVILLSELPGVGRGLVKTSWSSEKIS